FDLPNGGQGERGIIGHAVGSLGQHVFEGISCISRKEAGDPILTGDHRGMPHVVTGCRHHKNSSVLGDGMRSGGKVRSPGHQTRSTRAGTRSATVAAGTPSFFPSIPWTRSSLRVGK